MLKEPVAIVKEHELAVVVIVPDLFLRKAQGGDAGHGLFPHPVEYLEEPSAHFRERHLLGYLGVVPVKLVQGIVDNQPTNQVNGGPKGLPFDVPQVEFPGA
jgi:hypothetical protein